MIGLHFYYWCFVVLWPGPYLSVVLHPTWRRHFYVFTVFLWVLFSWGFAFFQEKKKEFWPQEGSVTVRGERGTERDQKKKSIFFHCAWTCSPVRHHCIELTTIITHLRLSNLCLILQVRLEGNIVKLWDFYSYRIIGKLTVFLQVQEFVSQFQCSPFTLFSFSLLTID